MPRILIANRGEIAVRIHRAARSLGFHTVAVFTAEDRESRHVQVADEAHLLSSGAGYLDQEELVAVARRADCSHVHPGYGFLSESAEFAALCAKAELTFVGPTPEVLALLGDKARARDLAVEVGVPVLSATGAGTTIEQADDFRRGLGAGAAVMVKAVSGGGGRGLRVVRDGDDLAFAMERCRSEAERAFGRGEVYVEQYLPRAKHVEVQIIGDGTGEVSHLWDRECSIQRRNQKLVEVAPCPTLTEEQRRRMLDAARRLAAAVGYSGLGTFEFLVDAENPDRFFFMEANPRVQVEHTITEEITGIDLVAAQLEVASGRTLADLGLLQSSVPAPQGIAVQTRVNAEVLHPDGSAHASSGRIEVFEVPTGPGVRVDTDGFSGRRLTGRYDPLLAKVITHTRGGGLERAAAHARAALKDFRVIGPGTNIGLLLTILKHPDFVDGSFTTDFVDSRLAELLPASAAAEEVERGDGSKLDAPFAATVVAVQAAEEDHVTAGAPLIVLEAMKMEHVLTAPLTGKVDAVLVTVGETVAAGTTMLRLTPDLEQTQAVIEEEDVDLEAVRPDLAEVVDRHRIGLDEARPEAVAKRRRTGQRTARENVADLCDDGTFTEYGALAIAAQRRRRSVEDLIANTPADGMVTGLGQVNGDVFGPDASRCVVMSYDYTVLAGTQGLLNHKKTDRMLELAERQRIPVVLFAEGGGGRPGDTDTTAASALDVTTFSTMGRLSGLVPTVGIASGRCFAGNAALLGCCDVIIATKDANIGMGGPAMIEGGGLGVFHPEEVGPTSVQVPNGVIDVLVDDEAEAVSAAKRYLSYFQGCLDGWSCADQRRLRHVVPENRTRVYDVRKAIDIVADTDSVFELRPEFGVGIVTALIRIEGRPMGLVANNPHHLGGAIDAPAADKLARFLQLCDAHGLPIVSFCDTPGFMVGPAAEETATVRHFSRLFVTGANLSVPMVALVLRKGYGLGAQAMVGGGFRAPIATLGWPTGEVGGMGLEGAVRLGYRRELEAIEDPVARQRKFEALLSEEYERGKALNAAAAFELDDVIDPAETRTWVRRALPPTVPRPPQGRSFIDTW